MVLDPSVLAEVVVPGLVVVVPLLSLSESAPVVEAVSESGAVSEPPVELEVSVSVSVSVPLSKPVPPSQAGTNSRPAKTSTSRDFIRLCFIIWSPHDLRIRAVS